MIPRHTLTELATLRSGGITDPSYDVSRSAGLPHPLDSATEAQRISYEHRRQSLRDNGIEPYFEWLSEEENAAWEAKRDGAEALRGSPDALLCGAIDVLRAHGEDDLASAVAGLRFEESALGKAAE